MPLRRIPVLIATQLVRRPHRVARENAALAALEARRRRHEREDVEAFLDGVLPAQHRRATVRRPG